jgi:hypothetical protein
MMFKLLLFNGLLIVKQHIYHRTPTTSGDEDEHAVHSNGSSFGGRQAQCSHDSTTGNRFNANALSFQP